MNPFDPETWKNEWTTISSAPFSMLVAIIVVGWIIWWFLGKLSEAQIAGLKERIAVLEERVRLAVAQTAAVNLVIEKTAASDRAKDEAEKDLQNLKIAIAGKADKASLTTLTAKLDTAMSQWGTANNEVSSSLSEISPFTIDYESEADYYLKDLLSKPEYRSMDEVLIRAQKLIKNPRVKAYFIDKAKEILGVN
jgi:hypothetical protein